MKEEGAETGKAVDRVEYIPFDQLAVPSNQAISR